MAFQKAVKYQAKLRLALCGLAGSGKTFSSLSIGSEIGKLIRAAGQGEGRIAVIDSEHGSASLYADKFDFDVCELDSFSPMSYVERIKEAESAGYDIIVVDSLSHAWAGKDGALDQKDQAADRGGNSWTAWRSITPKHNALVDALVGSKSHIVATMRQKMEYVQDKDEKGKTEIKKVGLAAIQREGMEFEFTLVGDIDHRHMLKISKTRCDGIDVGAMFEKPGESFAKLLYNWLMAGATPPVRPVAESVIIDASAFDAFLAALSAAPDQVSLDRAAGGPGKPAKGTPESERAKETYLKRKAEIAQRAA